MKITTSIFLLLCLTISCASPEKTDDDYFLRIGKYSFSLESFEKYIHELTDSDVSLKGNPLVFDLLDQYVDEQIILIKASEDMNMNLKKLTYPQKKKLLEKYILENITGKVTVSNDEVLDYYQNKATDSFPKVKVEAWHIQTETREDLDEVLKAYKKDSSDFAGLAKVYSVSPDKGKLLCYERGSLPSDIEEVLFSTKEGGISEPVSTSYGFHVFKVASVLSLQPSNDEQAIEKAKETLLEEKARTKLTEFIKKLKKDYKIKINIDKLSKDIK